jgi:hypothetical protein
VSQVYFYWLVVPDKGYINQAIAQLCSREGHFPF